MRSPPPFGRVGSVGASAFAWIITERLNNSVIYYLPPSRIGEAWLGITLAYYTDWPVTFCIAILSAAAYFGSIATPERRVGSKAGPILEQQIS